MDIEKEILNLESLLRDRIKELGITESSKITGEKKSTLSQYINNKRKFSYKKIITLSGKFEIK